MNNGVPYACMVCQTNISVGGGGDAPIIISILILLLFRNLNEVIIG